MYLSRVELPWDAVRNPYEIHRYLWRLFPDHGRETRRQGGELRQGFLFRIEKQAPGRPARLLVQSRHAPVPTEGMALLGSREFSPAPSIGQRLAFVLTANPVKTIIDAQRETKVGKESEKCRVPLIKEEEQRAWLARKLAGAGELENTEVLPQGPMYFRKGNRPGKLATCTFEGVVHVTSPSNLVELMENGVGPAKAFGCGLLLVRRI